MERGETQHEGTAVTREEMQEVEMDIHWEQLSPGLRIQVSQWHRFGTDGFLLSDFGSPRRKDRVCDLCAGCGIVGMLWFRDVEQAPQQVTAVEIDALAVRQMQASVQAGGLPADRFIPLQGDLRDDGLLREMVQRDGFFDVVTCNPPYKKQGGGILSQRSLRCQARHEVSCLLEQVCRAASRLLRYGGRFCLCLRPERLGEACVALAQAGLEPKRMRLAAQKPGKPPWLVLLEGRKGGRPHMQVEPTLYVEEGGGVSPELLRIYRKAVPGSQ